MQTSHVLFAFDLTMLIIVGQRMCIPCHVATGYGGSCMHPSCRPKYIDVHMDH